MIKSGEKKKKRKKKDIQKNGGIWETEDAVARTVKSQRGRDDFLGRGGERVTSKYRIQIQKKGVKKQLNRTDTRAEKRKDAAAEGRKTTCKD